MASIPVNVEQNHETGGEGKGIIRVIVADTQAIFRAGLRKIFALEDDIRVVGQAETLAQTQSAMAKFSDEVLTLELFRRGAHGIVSREVEPELLVDCLRKVAGGETWLDTQGVHWVMEAYRNQSNRPAGSRPKVQLTPKETLIVSCATQGMKNKEIALRVGTTEQVVKNYLRKVYDKLGVADRLELALYCLNHRVVDHVKPPPIPATAAPAESTSAVPAANSAAAGAAAGASTSSASSTSGSAGPDSMGPNKLF